MVSSRLVALQVAVSVGLESNNGQYTPAFDSFIKRFGRPYIEGSPEYEHRRSIYEKRLEEVDAHNEQPTRLWTAGVNHLADLTDDELHRLRGWKGVASSRSGTHQNVVSHHGPGTPMSLRQPSRAAALPEEISWTHLNATNINHDQGQCGSCWATATSLMLTANNEIHKKNSRTFSEQELVNCVPDEHKCGGTGGCDGNTVELAMAYVLKNGLSDNHATPYTAQDGDCSTDLALVEHDGDQEDLESIVAPGVHKALKHHKGFSDFGLMGWERLPENKYEPLMRALVERGPVAVTVFATPWQLYRSGIFDSCDVNAILDHAVALVGYGHDKQFDENYWLIQNSWGQTWGEHGRIRILRRDNEETHCGIDNQPEAGTGCEGGPKKVKVCGTCGILYDNVVAHFSN